MTFCPHCGAPLDAPQPPAAVVPPDLIAQRAGFADGCFGRLDDSRWPAGQPGHADYHLGHREGKLRRTSVPIEARKR